MLCIDNDKYGVIKYISVYIKGEYKLIFCLDDFWFIIFDCVFNSDSNKRR